MLKCSQVGFTLTELMIVIAIIWLLATFLFPSLTNYLERSHNSARVTSTRSFIANIQGKYEFPLISYYSFDEWAWLTINDRWNTNTNNALFPANWINWVTGHIGKAIQCSFGWNGVISHDESLNVSSQFSISLWLNPASSHTGYAAHPITKFGVNTVQSSVVLYYFWTTSWSPVDRTIMFYANAGSVWKSITAWYVLPINTWTNISMSFDSFTGGQLYVNGIPYWTKVASPWSVYKNIADLYLCDGFPWMIDDLHIYNRVLSDQEMLDLYNAGK